MKLNFKRIIFSASIIGLAFFSYPQTISVSDKPDGFASVKEAKSIGGAGGKSVTVRTRDELMSAVRKGRQVIYVDGMIDISNGLLPSAGGSSNAALDSFVKEKSGGKFTNYKAFVDAYTASCSVTTDDGSSSSATKSSLYSTLWTLNRAYQEKIVVRLVSDLTIIGLGAYSGIKGGSINIADVSNIVLRNLNIYDGYDPFPHHEKNDGYNAQHDAISIVNASNIWIDHCTIGDTLKIAHVKTGGAVDEKWQNYDGLCDIKGNSKNITISYCHFKNHDKTMLIGSSDSESISTTRTVTLHHNYFENCVQRLPMVRLTNVHTYNNYFNCDPTSGYASSYVIGVRYNSNIISENNYFGSGIKYSVEGTTSKKGNLYSKGDIDKSVNKKRTDKFNASSKPTFEIPYEYQLEDAKNLEKTIPFLSGAGVYTVNQQ